MNRLAATDEVQRIDPRRRRLELWALVGHIGLDGFDCHRNAIRVELVDSRPYLALKPLIAVP